MSDVIIADDSPFMRRILKEILENAGYNIVAESQNGLEAMESYKHNKADLVLMDYNMPKMNGVEAARNILQHDSKANIIMVTSIGGRKTILDALRIGVKNYVTKPFEGNVLLATLGKVMGESAPLQARRIVEQEAEFQVIGSFFGQYLLQKGLLTKEQLLQSLEIQNSVNRKIGQIAIEEGLLLPQHVETILKMQKRINKYFGQLSIQMGFMTQEKVSALLEKQKAHYVEVEEILMRENMLPKETLKKELELFRMLDEEDQGVFNMRWVSRHIQNGFVYETFIEQTLKLFMRLAGIFVMEGECSFDRKEFVSHGFLIKIKLTGDSLWSYHLNLSEDLAAQIAEAMLESEDEMPEGDTLNIEAANEFANIACGNALGKLDGKGYKFDITPPTTKCIESGESFGFGEKEQVLCVPILVPEGEMELLISGVDIFKPVQEG